MRNIANYNVSVRVSYILLSWTYIFDFFLLRLKPLNTLLLKVELTENKSNAFKIKYFYAQYTLRTLHIELLHKKWSLYPHNNQNRNKYSF